jgi:hypothetical protein
MDNKLLSDCSLKAVCSVTEMSQMLDFSRGRFYQLIEQGVFPPPIYDIRTRRPYYTAEQQQVCLQVRQTNIDWQGRPILFYSPRKKGDLSASPSSSAKKGKKTSLNPHYQEIAEALVNLGIQQLSSEQVHDAVTTLFPNQTLENLDQGAVIRQLFRFFKSRAS